MNQLQELHREAMRLADFAFSARRRGEDDEALRLFEQAFEQEAAAAQLLRDKFELEPTRSVLYRSAATLALDAGRVHEAEKLIAAALFGNPPEEIADELRDLLERVHFERHLSLRGVSLERGEIQMSLAGEAIGLGIALADAVVTRVTELDKLIQRTVERMGGREFREAGRPKKRVIDAYALYMSAPRAGSFSVTFRLGRQTMLPGLDDTDEVIAEVIECLALLNSEQYDGLRHRIRDDAYFRNFVGIAKKMAPDGDDISFVGLTADIRGRRTDLSFTIRPSDIVLPPSTETESEGPDAFSEPVMVTGVLAFADKLAAENQIRIKDAEGKTHRVIVPTGLMNDIVRPLWDQLVVVSGMKRADGVIRLNNIEPVDDIAS